MNVKAKIDPQLLVLVSNHLIGPEGVPVAFAFRTEALDPQDSGWNFWSGGETDLFIKESSNFERHPLKHFLDLDRSLLEIVDAEVGSVWEKDPESEAWVEVEE
jgi:hypothetical protein